MDEPEMIHAHHILAAGSLVLAFALLPGCQRKEFVFAEGSVQVLQEAYPLSHGASAETGNQVVAMLQEGDKAEIVTSWYGKDFLVYKVRLPNGKTGYVIHGEPFRIVQE